MEVRNGKTIVWVPKEEFDSVQKLWKPEFSWLPVPVDRSLPPDQIAYIETRGPVSPLPPRRRKAETPLPPPSPLAPLSPLPPVPRTPRTPAELPPLATAGLSRKESGYFKGSPELDTAITAGFSPGNTDVPDTPSTATEPETPSTPRDSPGLPKPAAWRPTPSRSDGSQQAQVYQQKEVSQPPQMYQQTEPQPSEYQQNEYQQNGYQPFGYPQFGYQQFGYQQPEYAQAAAEEESQPPQPDYASLPWKMFDDDSVNWRMPDVRGSYLPKPHLKPASWKTLDGGRELKMSDRWQTFRRDEAHWNGSKKGFAVRLDMHLNMEVEMRGTVNGDITLSAEALYVSAFAAGPLLLLAPLHRWRYANAFVRKQAL